jgi:hypothetical protein
MLRVVPVTGTVKQETRHKGTCNIGALEQTAMTPTDHCRTRFTSSNSPKNTEANLGLINTQQQQQLHKRQTVRHDGQQHNERYHITHRPKHIEEKGFRVLFTRAQGANRQREPSKNQDKEVKSSKSKRGHHPSPFPLNLQIDKMNISVLISLFILNA